MFFKRVDRSVFVKSTFSQNKPNAYKEHFSKILMNITRSSLLLKKTGLVT